MPVAWDSALPAYMAADQWQVDGPRSAIYTETPSGRLRGRQVSRHQQEAWILSFIMDGTQVEAFRSFWHNVLAGGSLPFQGLPNPLNGQDTVWQPASNYTIGVSGAPANFLVSFRAMRMPDTVFAAQATSIDLDGTERLASAAGTIGIADTWTVAGWFKRMNANDAIQRTIFQVAATTPTSNWIEIGHTDAELYVFCSNSSAVAFKELSFASRILRNKWTHIAVAFDGAEAGDPIRVYVNGVLITPTTTTTDTTGTMTDTSRRVKVSAATFADAIGRAHSLGIWSTELTAAEIASIYYGHRDFDLNTARDAYVSQGSLQHWFRIGHNSANIGLDYAATPFGSHDLMASAVGITSADIVTDSPIT